MGIVNVNDDSFSGDGTLDVDEAIAMAVGQAESGADVIDVGAESARTNREAISLQDEITRFRGFFDQWGASIESVGPRDEAQIWPPVVSANTWRPEVVEAVLSMGVELINDMGGLPDDRNARACASAGASLLIMHSVGEPKVPHLSQQWDDVMASMEHFFSEKLSLATEAGLEIDSILLDPGIDFAKQREDNLKVYRELDRLSHFGRPLLVPVSRKTVIGDVLDLADPNDRDAGTMACISAAVRRGGNLFRVHDVGAAWQVVRMLGSLV